MSDDEGPQPLPPQKKRKTTTLSPPPTHALSLLPISPNYSRSYMHRDQIHSIHPAGNLGMLLTLSLDGVAKFWKRTGTADSLEFVKSYQAHVGTIAAATATHNGTTMASVGGDGQIKIYAMETFDITALIKTPYTVKHATPFGPACIFVGGGGMLAVSHLNGNGVSVFDVNVCDGVVVNTIACHNAPVTVMRSIGGGSGVVSGSSDGMLEYWNAGEEDVGGSYGGAAFESKFDTDLFKLAKKGVGVVDLVVGGTTANETMAVYGGDRKIRLFQVESGKCVCVYEDGVKGFDKEKAAGVLKVDDITYGKLCSTEREVEGSKVLQSGGGGVKIGLAFDETGRLLLIPTLCGVKVIDTVNHRVVRTIGGGDMVGTRFTGVVCLGADPRIDQQMKLARGGGGGEAIDHSEAGALAKMDPMVVGWGFEKKRVYCFSKFEGEEGERDVFNEPPDAEDMVVGGGGGGRGGRGGKGGAGFGSEAILRTSEGDIHFKLFEEVPRTIENFVTHSKNGYYDNIIFHRVIKGFMLQTGDPKGDGTGGESIWGGEFEDEIVRGLRHDRPFTVSMANAGAGTNGSQFFITTVPTPWLDGKHTVFGRVTKGMDVCTAIEDCVCDHLDKPTKVIKIISVDIV